MYPGHPGHPGHPDDEPNDWPHERLSDLLREEGDRHEPDRTLILARVEAGRRHLPTLPGGTLPGRRRRGDHLWLAAAATAVVGVATVTWTFGGNGHDADPPVRPLSSAALSTATISPPVVPAATTPPVVPPSSSTGPATETTESAPTTASTRRPSATRSPSATPSRSLGAPASTSSEASTETPAPPSPPVTTGEPGAAPTLATSSVVGAVQVPGTLGTRDWAVVGARSDGAVVRRKGSPGTISAPVPGGGATQIGAAPFTVSWSGGAPEQDHSGATTWSTVPAEGGSWRTVVRPTGPGTLSLLVGTSGGSSRLRVVATLDGAPTASWVTGHIQGGTELSVSWGDVPAGATLTVTVSVSDGSATRLGMSVVGLA